MTKRTFISGICAGKSYKYIGTNRWGIALFYLALSFALTMWVELDPFMRGWAADRNEGDG